MNFSTLFVQFSIHSKKIPVFSAYDCNLQNNKFLCGNNETCIPLEKVCDGTKGKFYWIKLHLKLAVALPHIWYTLFLWIPVDCSSGDDESDECVKQKKKKICSKSCTPNGHCVNLPTGQTCACPKGFKFNEKRGECEVIFWDCVQRNFSCKHWPHNLNWFRISTNVWNSACVRKVVSIHWDRINALVLRIFDWWRTITHAEHTESMMQFCFIQPAKR